MPETTDNGKLQGLLNFTVQIRRPDDKIIVGTGVAVSTDGKIVTCAHVVKAALQQPPQTVPEGAQVRVRFPHARGGEEKSRWAVLAGCFPEHDDDIVVLQLVDGPPPLDPEQVAVLGCAAYSGGNHFRAYGFRSLPPYSDGWAEGKIMGQVLPPKGKCLQAKPVEIRTRDIRKGLSGAAVLDERRNLIVGLISRRWKPRKADEPDNVGWAVDSVLLTFEPLNRLGIPVSDVPHPRQPIPTPPELPDPRMALLRPTEPAAWHGAPPVLDEWVGRKELLRALSDDWESAATRITALVGFGGEGKSSLAREWVEQVKRQTSNIKGQEETTPTEFSSLDSLFWWSFYDEASVDAFAESLLDYLGGGRIDTRAAPSAAAKLELCARLLQGGRVLLVLDGFEVMQHQGGEGPEGDRYGLIQSSELRRFLEYLAAPESAAFCLITSRAPLLDLLPYTTCTQRDVTRLSLADGRALLRELGVQGPDKALDAVVRAWDGHALTLNLLGSLLAERHGGDLARLDDLPLPTADETKYERVHRVLRRYDEHLTGAERDVLKRFSLFRTPVTRAAVEKLYHAVPTQKPPDHEIPQAPDQPALLLPTSYSLLPDLDAILQRLIAYRLLRHNPRDQTYTTHPLIRSHYLALFTKGEPDATRAAHERIKDYYLELAGDTPHFPTLDDLRSLIEVVHHACRAGAYDEAFDDIFQNRVHQRDRYVLTQKLGAWETMLALMYEFFPRAADGAPDLSAEPQVSYAGVRRWILNEVGLCLMNLGRLREAVPFYERGNAMDAELGDWRNASLGYINLAELHISLGDLASGADAAREARTLARKAGTQQDERSSLACLAWAEHLRGESEMALAHFAEAEALEREIDSRKQYLYSLPGIWHAETLLHTGEAALAQRITEANQEILTGLRALHQISMCHRMLGNIAVVENRHDDTRRHYNEALRIARSISYRPALIEALLARGDPQGFQNLAGLELDTAFDNLNEALGYAIQGGYRIYEADIRAALARAYRIQGDPARAREQGLRARALSEDMGYHLRERGENGEW